MWRTTGRALAQRPTIPPRRLLPQRTRTVRYASDSATTQSPAPASAPAETASASTPGSAGAGAKQTRRGGSRRRVLGTTLAISILVGYVYATDTRASIHRYAMVPLIRWVYPDAEDAHHAGVNALRTLYRLGLNPRERGNPDGDGGLATEVFGHTLANPIGISGGLDKHAEIPDALFDIGAAIVEVGGATPQPQEGNPRPRVFRVPSQAAMINRYGLNSYGAEHMAAELRARVRAFAYAAGFGEHDAGEARVLNGEAGVPPGSLVPGKLLAVQVAKNKATPDADIEAVKRDYVYCVDRLARYADVLVVNVSSPNTPGLRDLQATAPLTAILQAVVGAAKGVQRASKPAVMVKVSPDEDADEQVAGICEAVWGAGVDGVIVGNTTNRRPQPRNALRAQEESALAETGGYSGAQTFSRTAGLVRRYRALLDARLPSAGDGAGPTAAGEEPSTPRKAIFASGGISSGEQAQEVLEAGASAAMMYTGIVYGGVGTVTRVKQEMRRRQADRQADRQAGTGT
ncbi:Dihydroorotate dehydrogenase [Aspergillus sp. HF37]|nr:Dihydroorotate dehydrogenase [Aspergillus sp. HF37]